MLGLAYELGIDVEKDTDRAAFYYHIAAHKGSLDGEYLELSLKLDTDKRATPEIIGRMNELAESGCMKALVYWGDEVYLGNWGMAPDKETAYRWFNKAARLGDPVAKYFVGYGYRVGESVGTDYALAWMYFLESAQQHFPRAFRQIAMMYKKGQFVEKDLDTARKYYKKAVDSGDGLSVNYLGDLEYNDKNYEKAFAYYLEAAEYVEKMGLPNGAPYYNLGWSYEFEQGVARDIETAVDYYFKAVKLKHKSSAARISSTIFKLSDTAQKRELLEKASTLNCAEAEYYLAQTFEGVENGKTVKSADALRYYEKGADKGCLDCIENCMYYYSWLYGGDNFANRRKSLENFRLFFSLIDLPENEKYRKKSADVLVSKYYCYAAELDIDEENKKPDKSLALYYYRKCLDDARGMNYFVRISGIAHQYAMEHTSNSIYYTDYAHSEEIAELCFEYIDRALEHAKKENTDVSEMVKHLVDCYTMIYSTAKNKKARNKADFFDSRINAIKNKL